MLVRKIARLARGKATPAQIVLASVLGSMLGFVPGFAQGPGVIVVLTLLLIVLNANLFVAVICGLLAKALSLLVMPVTFAVGRVLLDGPTEGLFRWAINAPVLALFGFEHYATTGGVVVGLVVGVAFGWLIAAGIKKFRRTMMGLEERSPRYVKLSRSWWAKLLVFVFVGRGHGKKTYDELIARRVGNPIRPLGAVFAVLVVVLAVVVFQFTKGPIVTALVHGGLERANGATVDIREAELDLEAGRLSITGLAMADPNALSTDLLRAERLEADLSTRDLLRKRLAFDRVVLSDVVQGAPRKVPGRLVGEAPSPAPAPAETQPPDVKDLEDYLRRAEAWKDRLAQVRRWLERLSPAPRDEQGRRDDLAERVRQRGHARVRAEHLVEGAPTLAVYQLLAEKVRAAGPGDETLTIRGENLSTHPHLLDKEARISIESSGLTLRFDASMADEGGALSFFYAGLAAATALEELKVAPFSGGTIDLETSGAWHSGAPVTVELPLQVTLHDTTITLPGAKATPVKRLVVPIGVRGPLDDPRITLDDDALAKALVDAGAGELAARLQDEAGEAIGKAAKDLPPEAAEGLKKIGEGLGGLLGGDKKKSDPPEDPG